MLGKRVLFLLGTLSATILLAVITGIRYSSGRTQAVLLANPTDPYLNDKQTSQAEKIFKKAAATDAVLEAPELEKISAIDRKVRCCVQCVRSAVNKSQCVV
jgi:hypothetical protein